MGQLEQIQRGQTITGQVVVSAETSDAKKVKLIAEALNLALAHLDSGITFSIKRMLSPERIVWSASADTLDKKIVKELNLVIANAIFNGEFKYFSTEAPPNIVFLEEKIIEQVAEPIQNETPIE